MNRTVDPAPFSHDVIVLLIIICFSSLSVLFLIACLYKKYFKITAWRCCFSASPLLLACLIIGYRLSHVGMYLKEEMLWVDDAGLFAAIVSETIWFAGALIVAGAVVLIFDWVTLGLIFVVGKFRSPQANLRSGKDSEGNEPTNQQ